METDEHSLDLYWHALNYRSAATLDAEAAWLELEACVERLIRERVELELQQFTHE